MWNWIAALEKLRIEMKPAILTTVTQCTGSTPRETGAKMVVLPDGKILGTIGGGHLEKLVIQDALKCFEENASKTIRYPLGAKTGQCCGGIMEVLMETLNNGPRLYLFGAGHVGQALCRTLSGTPFQVHLIDEREEWVMSPKVPDDVIRFHGEWDDFVEDALWDSKKTYVVVMTHQHDLDQEIIKKVIQKKAAFIGLIGSKSKWARFNQRLTQRKVSEKELARVKCPVGISIGGKSPQEVAISISAELLKHHHGK